MFFTVEETNLMCCFDTSSRSKLISEMKKLPSKELDSDIAELICQTVRKLEKYNDQCRRCIHDCKQSFRTEVVACPRYFSKRSEDAVYCQDKGRK